MRIHGRDVEVPVECSKHGSDMLIRPAADFRVRPETWNRVEAAAGREWPKLVFAPPVGERASNVHVREALSATARRNLLFRDFCGRTTPLVRLGRL